MMDQSQAQPMAIRDSGNADSGLADILARFLDDRQEVLVDRSLAIAKTHGYAPLATTIRAAWVEAVLTLSESLCATVAHDQAGTDGEALGAPVDYGLDPRFARLREVARRHRSRGITVQMFLGLLKHFRNVYCGVLADMPGPDATRAAVIDRVRDFFDGAELSIVADWAVATKGERLIELQARTRALALDKDRYLAIFESLRSPAFLFDRARALVNANQAAAELFLGDAEAGDIVYLRHMRQRKSVLETMLAPLIDSAEEGERSVWLETVEGPRCFDVRMRPLHDALERTTLGHVLLLNDITAHRRAVEDAQRAERQMSRFLATISHEIRTPLHAVLGAADLLRTAEPGTRRTYLDVIEGAGQTLLQTLNTVLDYSKLEDGPPVPRVVPTDIAAALAAFRRVVVPVRAGQATRLSVDIADDVPACLCLDWAMTRQVLSNLVHNAIRFDDGRGVGVRVSAPEGPDGAGVVRFEVSDHGPGLSEEDAKALVQPFDETNARYTGAGGAGLGLAICNRLLGAMGGRIGAETGDSGTLVWFELPYGTDSADDAVPDPPPLAAPVARAEGQRCLLVDDDWNCTVITTHNLEHLGFAVDHADSVAAALTAIETGAYDAMVVDYVLPDGNGSALVRALRERGTVADARIIALTANVEVVNGAREVHALFDAVVAKPADRATLGQALFGADAAPVGPTDPAAERSALQELSPDSIRAMAQAFQTQWRDFRATLSRVTEDDPPAPATIADLAHRLAGSSALLGLRDLEEPLRDLERLCRADADAGDLTDLIGVLDRDPADSPSWAAIAAVVEGP
ncbi:ATP-binding protein [uncultured Rhodospira sp.]|uniref:ATP-binding protein n=1 Tax=uncultured Rhodospira sp. TaxID=1936189 RepID=UPI00261B6310|nr:ATP-binding protein [uncultured Rhodospira sp.]